MSDEPCETMIDSDDRSYSFQRWLVAERARPAVRRVWFRGAARASRAVLDALDAADLIVIGPSNPYVSIDPILALPSVRERVAARPVLAVSPIVHGAAVKGPLAAMLESLGGAPPEPGSIARHYAPWLSGMIVEQGDEASVHGLPVLATRTLMHTREASCRLARALLGFAARFVPGFGSP